MGGGALTLLFFQAPSRKLAFVTRLTASTHTPSYSSLPALVCHEAGFCGLYHPGTLWWCCHQLMGGLAGIWQEREAGNLSATSPLATALMVAAVHGANPSGSPPSPLKLVEASCGGCHHQAYPYFYKKSHHSILGINPSYCATWGLPEPWRTVLGQQKHSAKLVLTHQFAQFSRWQGLEGFVGRSKDGVDPFPVEGLCQPGRLDGGHQHAVETHRAHIHLLMGDPSSAWGWGKWSPTTKELRDSYPTCSSSAPNIHAQLRQMATSHRPGWGG